MQTWQKFLYAVVITVGHEEISVGIEVEIVRSVQECPRRSRIG